MLKEYLSTLANKFREIIGETDKINAQDFADKIVEVYEKGKAEGVTEGKPLGKLELLQDSEYMNAKVSGTAIAVNDVSPIEHSVGCSVASKNMFDYNKFINQANSVQSGWGGITTQFGEECFWFKGVPPSSSFKFMQGEFLENTQYTLSYECAYIHGNDVSYILPIFVIHYTDGTKENVSRLTYTDKFVQHSHTTKANKTVDYITTSEMASTITIYIKTNFQLEIGTTATAYTPYVADVGGIEVSRYGKNLFDKSNYVVDDGFIGFDISSLEIGKTYTFSSSIPIALFKISSNGNGHNSVLNATNDLFNTFTFVMAKHENISPTSKQYIFIRKERVEDPFVGNISELDGYDFQLEEGTTATPYEPFTKQTYQSTADGTVEGVKSISPNMTLLTNNNGVVINANYLRDIDTYINNLKTNVALTGGE